PGAVGDVAAAIRSAPQLSDDIAATGAIGYAVDQRDSDIRAAHIQVDRRIGRPGTAARDVNVAADQLQRRAEEELRHQTQAIRPAGGGAYPTEHARNGITGRRSGVELSRRAPSRIPY